MIKLVLGECPSCGKDARILLRKVGLMRDRDYYEVNRFELRRSKLFQEKPELYSLVTAVLYDDVSERYIDLKGLKLTQEIRDSIRNLANVNVDR